MVQRHQRVSIGESAQRVVEEGEALRREFAVRGPVDGAVDLHDRPVRALYYRRQGERLARQESLHLHRQVVVSRQAVDRDLLP